MSTTIHMSTYQIQIQIQIQGHRGTPELPPGYAGQHSEGAIQYARRSLPQ
jgi:hypothetical protein